MDFLRNCGAPAAEGGLVYSTCQHLRAIGKYQKTVQKVAGSIPALRAKQVVQLVRTFEGCKKFAGSSPAPSWTGGGSGRRGSFW